MIIKDVRSESFCSKTFIRWYGTKRVQKYLHQNSFLGGRAENVKRARKMGDLNRIGKKKNLLKYWFSNTQTQTDFPKSSNCLIQATGK